MKKRKAPVYPLESAQPHYDFIHPWMPRDLQKLRCRVAEALSLNWYDIEQLFTETQKRDKP